MNLSNPNKIALLTDSTADLSPAMLAGKPIYVVPLKILCQDGEYSDGVDIFAGDIYQRLRRGELPRTSLPSGGSVSDAFARIRADGYEKVIAIMLSSGLSGTYNMVRLQGQQQEGLEVAVFDSKSGALGIGVILLQLWEEIQAGAGWDTLVNQRVPHLIANTFPFFSVDTLEYLYKGGRIGKITAMAGSLLQIKPIITFAGDGQLQSVAKVRGKRQLLDKFIELTTKHRADRPVRRCNIAVANGGAPELMAQLRKKMLQAFPEHLHCWEGALDATLSVYIGDGVVGAGVQFID